MLFNLEGWNQREYIYQNGLETEYKRKLNICYVNVPLTFKKEIDFKNNVFFGEIGLYGGYALFGNHKYKNKENGKFVDLNEKLEFSKNKISGLTRFDYGVIAAAGINVGKADVGIKYKYGIKDIILQESRKTKNRNLLVFISYPLSKKIVEE